MDNIILYLRCFVANKFTLYSFIGVVIGFLIMVVTDGWVREVGVEIWTISCGIQGATVFGFHTFKTYQRTRDNIDNYGLSNAQYIARRYVMPCDKVGYNLAVKDFEMSK